MSWDTFVISSVLSLSLFICFSTARDMPLLRELRFWACFLNLHFMLFTSALKFILPFAISSAAFSRLTAIFANFVTAKSATMSYITLKPAAWDKFTIIVINKNSIAPHTSGIAFKKSKAMFFNFFNTLKEYLINIKQTVFLQNFPFLSLDTVVSTVAKNIAIPATITKYITAAKNI